MREILFRGKRYDNDEWVYGSFCMDALEQLNGPCGLDGFIRLFDKTAEKKKMQMYEVDRETVGQYTGLTDKNGKKIFEGDIVESAFTKKAYIVCFGEYTYTDDWGDEQEACGWYNIEDGGYKTAFGNPGAWANVIGNIHDNPELLGGAE